MAINEKVRARLLDLIETGGGLSRGNEYGQIRSQDHANECIGWIAAAHHIVQKFCPKSNEPYLMSAKSIVESPKTKV